MPLDRAQLVSELANHPEHRAGLNISCVWKRTLVHELWVTHFVVLFKFSAMNLPIIAWSYSTQFTISNRCVVNSAQNFRGTILNIGPE